MKKLLENDVMDAMRNRTSNMDGTKPRKKPFPQNVPYASTHFAYPVSTTSISENTNAILVQHLQRLILFSIPYVHMCKLSYKNGTILINKCVTEWGKN